MSALEPNSGDRVEFGLHSPARHRRSAVAATAAVLLATVVLVSVEREQFGGKGFGNGGSGGGGFDDELIRQIQAATSYRSGTDGVPAAVAPGESLSNADKAEILNLIIADILERIETPDAAESRPTVVIGTMGDVDLPKGFRATGPEWRFRYFVKNSHPSFAAIHIQFSRFAPEKPTTLFEGHVSVSVANGFDDRDDLLRFYNYRVERVNDSWSVAIAFGVGFS